MIVLLTDWLGGFLGDCRILAGSEKSEEGQRTQGEYNSYSEELE
jgi:hypothetical protein